VKAGKASFCITWIVRAGKNRPAVELKIQVLKKAGAETASVDESPKLEGRKRLGFC
jgi:hypothetical protein